MQKCIAIDLSNIERLDDTDKPLKMCYLKIYTIFYKLNTKN